MKRNSSKFKRYSPGEFPELCVNFEGTAEHRWDKLSKEGQEIVREGEICFCGKKAFRKKSVRKWFYGWPVLGYHVSLRGGNI